MAAPAQPPERAGVQMWRDALSAPVPAALTALTFVILFAKPMRLLAWDWWNNPEAGHGLLLAPLSLWFIWRGSIRPDARPNQALGTVMLIGAVVVRYAAGLAAELYTMKVSMVLALAGLVVFAYGFRQLLRWWLPFTLLWLSVPLPELVTAGLALPLQLQASRMGAALLEWRDIPVRLDGNVIRLPGHTLFVAEACSGLRSITSLLALSVLLGGMVLNGPLTRGLLILVAIPIAIVINAIRVFLTGFLVLFIGPEFGEGFMHTTEGWLMFLVAFALLGAAAWVISRGATLATRMRTSHA
ncbi:MAG TPA: exosortase/archaeosortase family protein [Gemmatimonadaceae bacterium]|nr:exosortase/archaeosortase family protein [Gemmatimonadaceae bacterium]